MHLDDFECPNCGANEMVLGERQRLECNFCGTSFGEVTRICPRCGHYGEVGARHCQQCGAQIRRECPACGVENSTAASNCVHCGRNLDLIEQMTRRWQLTTQQRLYDQMAGMASLKEEEVRASQERMAAFQEAERIRQEALALSRATRLKQDRQIFRWVVAGIVAFIFLVVVVMLLTAGGS
jgi:hypothetical protein